MIWSGSRPITRPSCGWARWLIPMRSASCCARSAVPPAASARSWALPCREDRGLRRAPTRQHDEALALEIRRRFPGFQPGEEIPGRLAGSFDQGGRVGDGLVAVGWKNVDDPDVAVGRGIGSVDDAERRLAAIDQGQSGTHTLGPSQMRLESGPESEPFQRRLGVFAGRYRLRIADGEPAVAECRDQIGGSAQSEMERARG